MTLLFATSGLAAAACGDDDVASDDPASSEDPAQTDDQADGADAAGDAAESATEGDLPSDEEMAEASEALDNLDLETKAEAIATAIEADEFEVVDESTVRFELGSGSSDDPVSPNCIAAEAMLGDDVQITMVYPDGELDC